MNLFRTPLVFGLLGVAAFSLAQTPPQASRPSGIDLKAIDKSVDPCRDFYQYACGNWMKSNPVPPQYAIWGRFNELQNRNLDILHEIAEDSAKNQQRSALDQKIGAFYASCMDEAAIEKAGANPIKPEIDRIRSIKDKSELPTEVARLHEQAVGVLFHFGPNPDPDEAKQNIATVDQGGLGLPEKGFTRGPVRKTKKHEPDTSNTSSECFSCWAMLQRRRMPKRRRSWVSKPPLQRPLSICSAA